MPATATARNRFMKQGTGENTNTWGNELNTKGLDLIDEALDGYESIALTGNLTLTSTNFASDQARKRFLKFTGSVPATVTIPAVSKLYLIWNATSETLTITMGGSDTAVLAAGARQLVACTGTGVYAETAAPVATAAATAAAASAAAAAASQSTASTAATSATASASSASTSATSASNSASAAAQSAANAAASTGIPSQTGNAGKYLTTDGTVASWDDISTLGWALISNPAVGGATLVEQTGLANYNEVLVVLKSVTQSTTPTSQVVLATSENNGSSYGSALGVTGTISTGTPFLGAVHIILSPEMTVTSSASSAATTIPNIAFAQTAKANAIRFGWQGATFSGGTVSIYGR